MISSEFGEKYGVDMEIALRLCYGNKFDMITKARRFIKQYGNTTEVGTVLFGDNAIAVENYVCTLKSESKRIGAYILHLHCKEFLQTNGTTDVILLKRIKNDVENAVLFWKLHLMNFYDIETLSFDDMIAELRIVLSARLVKNTNYVLNILKTKTVNTKQKILLRTIVENVHRERYREALKNVEGYLYGRINTN